MLVPVTWIIVFFIFLALCGQVVIGWALENLPSIILGIGVVFGWFKLLGKWPGTTLIITLVLGIIAFIIAFVIF